MWNGRRHPEVPQTSDPTAFVPPVTASWAIVHVCPLCEQKWTTAHGSRQHQGSQRCATQQAQRPRAVSSGTRPASSTTTIAARTLPQARPYAPVMRRIPKNARYQAASAFTTALERSAKENSPKSWAKLFAFAGEVFALRPTKGKRTVSLTAHVKVNVAPFETGHGGTINNGSSKRRKTKNATDQLVRQVNMRPSDQDVSETV